MRLFTCPACGETVFFPNTNCACGAMIAYDPEERGFVPLVDPCRNREIIACNWTAVEGGFCRSCAMTEVVPDHFRDENLALWAEAEQDKRRVLENLAKWGWFTATDPGPSPRFHLLAEETRRGEAQVTMGHANGLITMNVAESDPVELLRRREQLSERLRTMVAHYRHEIAHFLFERLRGRDGFLDGFRTLFGDERADYGEALTRHYENGPRQGWQADHVTPYAAAHPHEDWAETAAHLMHLTDILDSALAAGMRTEALTNPDYDPYRESDSDLLVTTAAGFGIAMNHVNRAMGLADAYPFVLTPAIREKLGFVHGWVQGRYSPVR